MPLRTTAKLSATLAAAAAATLALATPAVAGGGVSSGPFTTVRPADAAPADHLTITVSGAGEHDGTYELFCDTSGRDGKHASHLRHRSTHPEPREACAAIRNADDPFATTPKNALCTYVYGGPATAEIRGTWQGRTVHATFDRSNGCEISRWNQLVPALPQVDSGRG